LPVRFDSVALGRPAPLDAVYGPGAVPMPAQALPSPQAPKYEPRLGWTQPLSFLNWTAGAGNLVAQASWFSPTFNSRPDTDDFLQMGAGDQEFSTPIYRSAAYGAGGRVHALARGMQGLALDVEVFSVYYGHPYQSDLLRQITQPIDLTTDFWDGAQSALFELEPPGGPIKFWRVEVRFMQYSGAVGALAGTIAVEAAAY